MNLIIRTKNVEIEYQDDYSTLENTAKERIESILKTMYECEAMANPILIHKPIIGNAEDIFNAKIK